ncbi:hypothetical protein C8Q72DRAFT_797013 [Fomitopsis betulina]|nr:hypothetical protein C8Q72DRAFT_797013 [Fomitopsis betulina]
MSEHLALRSPLILLSPCQRSDQVFCPEQELQEHYSRKVEIEEIFVRWPSSRCHGKVEVWKKYKEVASAAPNCRRDFVRFGLLVMVMSRYEATYYRTILTDSPVFFVWGWGWVHLSLQLSASPPAFDICMSGVKFWEQGPGLEAVAGVLWKYTLKYPHNVMLQKWVSNLKDTATAHRSSTRTFEARGSRRELPRTDRAELGLESLALQVRLLVTW